MEGALLGLVRPFWSGPALCRTRDPYAILVSEVMLQQTQVARVLPRYAGWLERWPTVEALAVASAADVIRAWQGLGHNRRALALHRAAHRVASSSWPTDLTELEGVGLPTRPRRSATSHSTSPSPRWTSTSGACCGRTGVDFTPGAAQALMDLGATICLARIPRCGQCPWQTRARPVASARSLRAQGAFEGSFRQRRAHVLRVVGEEAQPASVLDCEAVRALERDGLVTVAEGIVSLPA